MKFCRVVLTVLCLVSACDVPQPFRHQGDVPLARPEGARLVVVVAAGADMDPDAHGAKMLVAALEKREIAAILGADPKGNLSLRAQPADRQDGRSMKWVLGQADQPPLGEYVQPMPPAPAAADGIARQVAAALWPSDTPANPQSQTAAAKRPLVRINALPPLPGDGTQSLGRAMKMALERRGLLVTSGDADAVIDAAIVIAPDAKNQDRRLDIQWVVRDAKGQVLGDAKQNGSVKPQAIAGPWGGLARDVAEGGADGILQVIANSGGPPVGK